MKKVWYILYIIFSWIAPFIVVFQFNVKLEEGGYNIGLFGILFVVVVGLIAYRVFNKRMNILDIQNRYKRFRVIYGLFKSILISGGIWWIFETISGSYDNLHYTLMFTFICICVGAGFRILSIKKDSPL